MCDDIDHVMQFFPIDALSPAHADLARPFSVLADRLIARLSHSPERTAALRRLLEARDTAMQALSMEVAP